MKCKHCGQKADGKDDPMHRGCRLKAAFPDCIDVKKSEKISKDFGQELVVFDVEKIFKKIDKK